MTHHHHGDVAVTLSQDHVSIDVVPVLLVQAAECLVEEQELASPHQRARHQQPLGLAGGEVATTCLDS